MRVVHVFGCTADIIHIAKFFCRCQDSEYIYQHSTSLLFISLVVET